jgi:hypothetical protein
VTNDKTPTPPPRDDRALNAGEKRELREAVLTFAPAVLVAFVLRWALVTNAGWTPRRALVWSIGVGIVVALLLQRAVRRRP